MIKLPEKLPVSIVVLVSAVFFGGTGLVIGYMYCIKDVETGIEKAQKEVVIEGEKKAKQIRKETTENVKKSDKLKERVKDGKTSITTGSGTNKRFTDSFVERLQRKINRAESFSD